MIVFLITITMKDPNAIKLKSEFRPWTREIFKWNNEKPKKSDWKEQERIIACAKAAFFDILDK